jgi:hypothetical protein
MGAGLVGVGEFEMELGLAFGEQRHGHSITP